MKLTEIQVDRCGIWRNLVLPVRPEGVHVFFGPNEAGKSTLRRFIRGVLFGFRLPAEESPDSAGLAAGSLLIQDTAGSRRVHRAAGGELAGNPRLITGDVAVLPRGAELFGDSSERVFDSLFALDLRELNELSSLSGDEVSQHVFGLTLGPQGERLLRASRRIDQRRVELLDSSRSEGELWELSRRIEDLHARCAELEPLRDRHTEWCLRRDQLEHEIASLRGRHAEGTAQLRAHVFLGRAWGPWASSRETRRELDSQEEIASFPDHGVERLQRIEEDLAAAVSQRTRLRNEVRRLQQDLLNPERGLGWRMFAGAMRACVDQRGWLTELENRCQAAQQQVEQCAHELQAACEPLGTEWTSARLEAVNLSTAVERRLAGTGESFRAAQVRRNALRRRCRQLLQSYRSVRDALAEDLHDLEGHSIKAAIEQARARLDELNELTTDRLREQELGLRLAGLQGERERLLPQLALPAWVHVVLAVFAFMGVILAGWGLVAGAATSGVAGTIYTLLGITCGGLAWGMKTQFENEMRRRIGQIDAAILAVTEEHAELRSRLGTDADAAGAATDLVVEAQEDLAELVALETRQQRIRHSRRRLAVLKRKLQTANLEVGTARQNWQELLARSGIPGSLSIDQAVDFCRAAAIATERIGNWQRAQRELSFVTELHQGIQQRITDLARKLPFPARETSSPFELLADWDERLAGLDRGLVVRRELRTEVRQKRREASRLRKQIAEIQTRRSALLVQGGAADRKEFEDRSRSFAHANSLRAELQAAQAELEAICAAHPDLALVEEDLLRFDQAENDAQVNNLRRGLHELESDLQRVFEHLGGVKREIDSLETDARAAHLRWEISQAEEQLQARLREWIVCEAAARTIDDLRLDLERRHQPLALAVAGQMLARMTGGKYTRIWVPLGERELVVSDERGLGLPVHTLSQGTREQLLLAVRLAIVQELAKQGICFPVILDDVLVNCDEDRARATVDLLAELGEQGLQILFFTCHQHLAQLFASRGVEPTRLPTHAPAPIGHDETRLAG